MLGSSGLIVNKLKEEQEINNLTVLILKILCNFTHCSGEKDWTSVSKDVIDTCIIQFIKMLEQNLNSDPINLNLLKVIVSYSISYNFLTVFPFLLGSNSLFLWVGKYICSIYFFNSGPFGKYLWSCKILYAFWNCWSANKVHSNSSVIPSICGPSVEARSDEEPEGEKKTSSQQSSIQEPR